MRRTIIMPQKNMSSESHTDGRSLLRKTLEGTSNIAYEKKNIVSAIRYCWSVICKSVSKWYSYACPPAVSTHSSLHRLERDRHGDIPSHFRYSSGPRS